MFKYMDLNPCRKQNDDCVIRAVATMFGISWKKAYTDLCNYGLLVCDLPNSASTITLYLKEKGFKRYIVSSECPACYTLRDFCEEYPYGDFIVLTDGHAVTVINGNYYDNFDSGGLTPVYYWKKEE